MPNSVANSRFSIFIESMGYDATVWIDAGMSAIKLQKGTDTPAETAVVNQKAKESVLAFIKAILARPERF
ncbi:MAG: hypothetical protein AAEJ59_11120, partial [Arenicellales bacterium]